MSASLRIELADQEATEDLGRRLAGRLRAGDLVILSGDLGAGKTTLTRGLGARLGVRGAVTSPTFVVARRHPARDGGPELLHIDAYRLTSPAEVDDLDLDLSDAVTVVEWGTGRVEHLSESRLEIQLAPAGDGREAAVDWHGPRWDPAAVDDLIAALTEPA
jgi:tRNA threonylcarbamoyladenosine biosynthesis protein TsaE